MSREQANLEVEFALDYQSASAAEIVYVLDSVAERLGMHPGDYSQAHQVKAAEDKDHLLLSGRIFVEISGGSIAGLDHDLLMISSTDTDVARHAKLVELFAEKLDVKQAFIHNRNYWYWQNASDVLEYDSVHRDHSSLPKISNGLPAPLEEKIIDTSRNPGRYLLRDGFRESVASPMWIRPELILDQVRLESIPGIRMSEVTGLVRIETDFMPFTSGSGDQGTLQNRIREAIYPN